MRFQLSTIILSLLLAFPSYSQNVVNSLRPGDIILLPLQCYVCSLIEDETDSEYSHSGIVVKKEGENIYIAQALGNVHYLPLKQFLRMKDPNREARVVRAQELQDTPISSTLFFKKYMQKYHGLPFDHDYLWNNSTSENNEKLYCAEFLAKMINNFLQTKIEPTPMQYQRNYDYWVQYFGHQPPQGLPGVSPSTFEKSSLFMTIGFIP